MATDDLKQTLLALHAMLASGEKLDPELQDLLRLLDADIRTRLTQDSMAAPAPRAVHAPATASAAVAAAATRPAAPAVPTQSISATGGNTTPAASADLAQAPTGLGIRAQEISARFAAAHPHLEPVLRELTDTLQRIGI